ncbi:MULTISPECIES: NAD(P)H-dependent oxidoreductase [Leptospira]|uniref:NAD(P)H-dependent oxidoreductase n=1 Tax=Leptospira TaxID=171 RepID=UPI0010833E1B|nr:MULTISPECIES: NAD(P)H-dependent oxidoreductase [Leptospira]MBL0954614.1 NAD(P)H-dependent oxidoreductase [Leptospira sp.]TGK97282.1 sodium:proton antiporter [Leptospira levettii]
MPKILIQLFHPFLEKSKANQMLLDSIPISNQITLRDLYEIYPNFTIDVKLEQKMLMEHDVILFQHPFYWYSCPPLMKQWIDFVLEDGWAYGKNGNSLNGKKWIQTITTGGSEKAYKEDGFHKHPIEDFLLPFRRTAELCKMDYQSPFLVQGTFQLKEGDFQKESLRYRNFILSYLEAKHG